MIDLTPNPVPDEDEPALGSSISDMHMRLSRAFHAQRRCLRPVGRAMGIGPGQPRILVYLAVTGGCTQRQVADYFEIDPAAVSRMLDSLDRQGLVELAPSHDRRTKSVAITERGRAAVRAWDRACARVDALVVEGLSDGERSQLFGLLERICDNLSRITADDLGRPELPGPAVTAAPEEFEDVVPESPAEASLPAKGVRADG